MRAMHEMIIIAIESDAASVTARDWVASTRTIAAPAIEIEQPQNEFVNMASSVLILAQRGILFAEQSERSIKNTKG